jgi:hypothetical protein
MIESDVLHRLALSLCGRVQVHQGDDCMARSTGSCVPFLTTAISILIFQFSWAADSTQAQAIPPIVMEGYVTAAHLPDGFDMNGQHVAVSARTAYGKMGDRTASTSSPIREEVRAGAYVSVSGFDIDKTKIFGAQLVLVRDDLSRALSGVGVIVKVIANEPEALYEADGYRIRVTAATKTSFNHDLKSLADVGPNVWIRYEGKLDQHGDLVASRAKFTVVQPKEKKSGPATDYGMDFVAPDLVAKSDGRVRVRRIGKPDAIPADTELQTRISRIGMSLVPEYQRSLADDDPDKIRFAFFAVDDDKVRDVIGSLQGGLVLVPKQMLQRLQNENQIAAMLADGVASSLQRQEMMQARANKIALGEEFAGLALLAFSPGSGVALIGTGLNHDVSNSPALQQQRARVALALMADAGYDVRQAPEAWRLAGPKKLPKNLDKLQYPDLSDYQLSVLNLQYRHWPAAEVQHGDGSRELAR